MIQQPTCYSDIRNQLYLITLTNCFLNPNLKHANPILARNITWWGRGINQPYLGDFLAVTASFVIIKAHIGGFNFVNSVALGYHHAA